MIYEFIDSDQGKYYSQVSLDEITDPDVCARIDEELRKLPTTP
jgi:hypothetical protein